MSDTPLTGPRSGRPLRRTAALALAGLLVGLLPAAAPTTAQAATGAAEARSDRYETVVVRRINRARARHDLRPLRVVPCVDVVAERRVDRPLRPVRAARLDGRKVRRTCGRVLELETTRMGSARAVVRSWLRREGTRSGLLDRDARLAGVGATFVRGRGWRVTLLAAAPLRTGGADGIGTAPRASSDGTGSDSGSTSGDPATDSDGTLFDPSAGGADTDATTAMDALELAILGNTNRRRANHGLPPLKPAPCAAGFAGEHSDTMAGSGTFTHADLADLRAACGGAAWAENIAMGSGTTPGARSIVQLWMESKGHRANILDPDLTHLGVGVARGPSGWYATQDFLSR